jgi:hypothetical protein
MRKCLSAAFAACLLGVEGFGLRGSGAHSNVNEYILVDSIEPRTSRCA